METQLEATVQNGHTPDVEVDPLKQINQANLQLASILEQVLKDPKLRQPLLNAIDRQQPVEEGEIKNSAIWLQGVTDLCEVKRQATDELVKRAVGGL